jgi:hypothetical protein
MAITSKGGLFSLDLLLAFLASCFLVFFFLSFFSQSIHFEAEQVKRLSLSRKALSYADRLVKVSINSFSPGLALNDPEKRRTLPNYLSPLPLQPEGQAIKQVYLKAINFPFEQTLFLDLNQSDYCLVVERMVLMDVNGWPVKAVLGVKACE